MKKIILVSLFFFFVLMGSSGRCEDPCKGATLSNIQKHLPGPLPPKSKIIYQRKVDGLCESIIEIRGRNIPVYSTRKYVLIGQMFKQGKNVTLDSLSLIEKKIFQKVKNQLDKVVFFTYITPNTHPKHTIYFFTDPLCPFCHRTLKKLKTLAKDTNSKIKVIFCPVHMPEGEIEAEKVICSNMGFDKFINTNFPLKDKERTCKKGREILEASLTLARKLNIGAVPTFILEDGTKITGANIMRVEKEMAHLSSRKK